MKPPSKINPEQQADMREVCFNINHPRGRGNGKGGGITNYEFSNYQFMSERLEAGESRKQEDGRMRKGGWRAAIPSINPFYYLPQINT
jgi:hypothetical protein